jgi:hypothetical protein
MTAVARLASPLLAALLAQALGLASQPVTRRGLTAVVAILEGAGQTLLELLHLSQQRLHLLAQGTGLGFEGGDFLVRGHALNLSAPASPS